MIELSKSAEVSMADEWFGIASADHFWMTWRFKVIQHLLLKFNLIRKGQPYLEVGCGHGEFMKQSEQHLGVIMDGCDLNLRALEMINGVKGNVYVYNIYDKHPDLLRKYEGVFLLDVIEHIDDDRAFVETAVAHVKSEGVVVINVPALTSLFSRYDVAAGHKRRYTADDLKQLFQKCGIDPIVITHWGMSLLPIALLRKIYLSSVSTEKIIEKGFRPPSKFIHFLLKTLMRTERAITSTPALGTSLVAIGRLKASK